MPKKNNMILIIVGVVIILVLFGGSLDFLGAAADISTAEITRSISDTSVMPGATFTVTYTSTIPCGADDWAVNILEDVTGGCTPTQYPTGYFSDEVDCSSGRTRTFTAPATPGTCNFVGQATFTSDYSEPWKDMVGDTSINIVDCSSLRSTAGQEMTDWIADPTSTNLNIAQSAIVAWISQC